MLIAVADGEGKDRWVRKRLCPGLLQHIALGILQGVGRFIGVKNAAIEPIAVIAPDTVQPVRLLQLLRPMAQPGIRVVRRHLGGKAQTAVLNLLLPQLRHGLIKEPLLQQGQDPQATGQGGKKHQRAQGNGQKLKRDIVPQISFLPPACSPGPRPPSGTGAPRD